MGVCILGMGDCGNKSSSSFVSNVRNINQTMTNMVSSTSQSVRVTQINVQSNKIKLVAPPGYDKSWGPLSKNCVFKNTQEMNATQKVSVTLDLSSTKNLQTQVSTALKNANENAVKQKTDFLQTASNSSSSATTINQAIENLVSTNINDTVKQSLDQLMKNAQTNELEITGPVECAPGTAISENVQKMVVSQISEALTKALTGTTLSNVSKLTSDNTNKNNADQEGGGIGSVISSVFKGLTGLLGTMGMIWVAIIGIVVIGAIFFLPTILKAVGGGGTTKMGNGSFAQMLFGRRKVRFGRRFR